MATALALRIPGTYPRVGAVAAPLLPTLFVIACALPQGLSISPGGLLLTAPRLVLIAALPVLLWRFSQRLSNGKVTVAVCDVIVILAGCWMFLSISATQGVARALVGANIMVLEFCGGYFLIRSTLNNSGEAAAVARALAWFLAVDGALSILDVIAERPVLHDLAQSITGFDQPWQQDYRRGFMRALGMQEHPIAFGTACSFGALIGLSLMTGLRRIVVCTGCMIGLATSDSSAPIGGFVMSCCFIVYHRVMASYSWRWKALTAIAMFAVCSFFLIYPHPIEYLIDHITSNPADGYYRLLIWGIVGPLVLDNPLFGIGLENDFAQKYDVFNTIDCFWLCSAANFGIPGALLFALTLLGCCARPTGASRTLSQDDIWLARTIGLIIWLYFYIGMTVHFWGCVWILLGVFAAMRTHLGALASDRLPVASQRPAAGWAKHHPIGATSR